MESDVEHYYNVVESHLKRRNIWSEVVRRFPPMAIRSAVKRILEVLYETNTDPEILDWGSIFELLVDFTTIDDFIKYLEDQRYIPISPTKMSEQYADELERQLTDLLITARDISPEILERIRRRVAELTGEAEELIKLKSEVENLREKARTERKAKMQYARKARELEEKVRMLQGEIEKLRREAEEARIKPRITALIGIDEQLKKIEGVYKVEWTDTKAKITLHKEALNMIKAAITAMKGRIIKITPTVPPVVEVEADFTGAIAPPTIPPELEEYILWSKFSAALLAAGLDPARYRDRYDEEIKTVTGRPFEEKQRIVELLAREIVKEAMPPPPPPKPPPPPRPPEVAYVPLMMPEPKVIRALDPVTGEYFYRPSDECLAILMKIFPFPYDYYVASPKRQREKFKWPTLLMAIESALKRPDVYIPAWTFTVYPTILDWLRQLARKLMEVTF